MAEMLNTLVEMGFSKERAELAISRTKAASVEEAMEWLLNHDEEPMIQQSVEETQEIVPASESNENPVEESKPQPENPSAESEPQSPGEATDAEQQSNSSQEAKSIKCDDCGKLFRTQTEVEFHAAKSGHENFSESTEEKKPLSEEEKKEQLAKIEAKLKQRRLEREAREKQEELEREKTRIRSGKEMLEAKRKQEDAEIKKVIELRKREKQEEKLARERVRQQIEQDKLARKAKFSSQGGETTSIETKPSSTSSTCNLLPKESQPQNYSEVKLQIRLTNGTSLTQTFGAKEPLSAVRVFVEINRTDAAGPFSLMTTFPKKVFGTEDYDKPLDLLGLAPSAVLIVSKT